MYNFKVIPIELISSIYEKFIYAEDAKSARKNSTHYTPINLVDLVLSEVFKGLDGNAKVLDLSCGSGVFLVESLRRLIVKRLMQGEKPSRKLIRETLYNQIYGFDINPKAISIAAFSLYLTALELDYELEQKPTISDDLKFDSIIDRNLFASDAFNEQAEFNQQEPFINKQFDAIVGNPPWTKSKKNPLATHTEYCQKNAYPIAYGSPPDQAFWWRIGDFANNNTMIGIILHSKPFFSNDAKAITAKKELFTRFKIDILINFSKLRREKLFPKSEAPALIVIAKAEKPKQEDICYFVCPDRSVDYREHKIIEIGSENIKNISVFEIANDSDMLKVATWGSARDKYLIKQLKYYNPDVESISENSPKTGLKVGNKSQDSPSWLFNKKILPTGSLSRYEIKQSNLNFFNYTKIESPRKESIYKSPLVIISEKVTPDGVYCTYSAEDIIYRNSYSGIPVSPDVSDVAHYLNGIINSSVASYFLFLTASSWGIERNKIPTQDLARLPIPDPKKLETEKLNKLLEIESQLRQCSDQSKEKLLKQKLDKAVFDIYNLNQQEQILVEDMTQITIDWYMNREKSKAIKKPKFSQLEAYVNALISVIQPLLNTLNERKITAEIFEINQAPLQVIKFSMVSVSDYQPTIKKSVIQELESIVTSIADKLPQKIAARIYTKRNVRIYLENELYIVKPSKLIYWSRSAGLNDADIILAEHLGVNNASFR
ncbi:MAG TPA: hypothetical protein DCF68_12075 [Cyanothece sp. UBA12306]|nr:hypothetical protein [Cyanothece sp. UBA12306]